MFLVLMQWNINGFKNNYSELQALIAKYRPLVIALQETHLLLHTVHPTPINYKMITLNTSPTYGGVGILIHNSLQYQEIPLRAEFDSVCVEICSKKKLRIVSSYISPKTKFTLLSLYSTFNVPNNIPTIITGDFNSWHRR